MKEGILKQLRKSKSKTFNAFCFCFILGVALGSYFDLDRLYLFQSYILFFVVLLSIIIVWHKIDFRYILFFLVFFILGVMRTMIFQPEVNSNHIVYYNNTTKELVGQIVEEPDTRMSYTNYVISGLSYEGKVQLKTKLYPQYSFGDYLKIKCKLKPVENFDSKFSYDKYLARFGIYSLCYYPQITKDKRQSVELPLLMRLKQKIFLFKSVIANQIDKLWPEPQSSFMAGLLYGSRSGLPADLTNNFNRTGVTHIIAISGYNISIIVIFVMTGLIYIGFYRQQAFWVTLIMIFLFVIFTGASASVVRAAIMGSIVLLAQYLGRLSRIGNILILAIIIMLLFNPLILLYDIGFQLSFLATLGLVYLSPILSNQKTDTFLVNNLKELIVATLAAIIATLPLIIYQFGRLSIVAPVVNILVLWIIPWLMLFGFVAVIASFIFLPLGQIIAYLAGVGLQYVIIMVNWFGNQSWSSIEFTMPWWLMIGLYIILLTFCYAKNKRSFNELSQRL